MMIQEKDEIALYLFRSVLDELCIMAKLISITNHCIP